MSEGKKRFSRAQVLQQGIDFQAWEVPDLRVYPDDLRDKNQNRLLALQAFFCHQASNQEISNRYGVAKSSLYSMIKKAMESDEEGHYVGYRAAIIQLRTEANERRMDIVTETDSQHPAGDTGMFSLLLKRYPDLEKLIDRYAGLYKTRNEGGTARLVDCYRGFIRKCEELGIVAPEYPFTRADKAERSFSRHLLKRVTQKQAEKRAGERSTEDLAILPLTEPLQEVELDGHNIDCRITVEEVDTFGLVCRTEIQTLWIILVIDAFTRCVLGYSLAFGKNYDQTDILTAIYNSLAPHRRPVPVIAGLSYKSKGGFPNERDPELAWSTALIYKMDNAMAHKAKDVEHKLRNVVGCIDDFGPPHTPNERPIVERFFGYLVDNFSHRIVGSTGSSTQDQIRERLKPRGGDLSLLLTVEEMHHALDVVISDYNGRPHSGIAPHSPLDLFVRMTQEKGLIYPKVRTENRMLRKFVSRTAMVRVCRDGPYSAYINFKGVRYRNLPALSHVVGEEVMVEWDPMNISYLRVYNLKGGYLGDVSPPALWALPHSEKLRLRIQRALKVGRLAYQEGDSITDLLRRLQSSERTKEREAATYNLKHVGTATLPAKTENAPRPVVKPTERLTQGFILRGNKK
ncbi:Mu transposase C-terminal domain-containing protein [Pseudomonas sp. NPDC088444]|uniref:Mu transposase C-terminal domain-containing protein n=1 Tax=Pseudomonas sp. NPDC088444 TaxID=3364456 RepID=UPI00384F52A0